MSVFEPADKLAWPFPGFRGMKCQGVFLNQPPPPPLDEALAHRSVALGS